MDSTEEGFPDALSRRISSREAVIAVIGLGYVGLPLAAACARAGFRTVGFDTDPNKTGALNSGRSYIDAVQPSELREMLSTGAFHATGEFAELDLCDIIVICVPTPLGQHRDPDLQYVRNTGHTVSRHLRTNQLIILQSTSYPGTTDEILKPLLESAGLRSGSDFFLGFSPEREDPGNQTFITTRIPKVVSGDGASATFLVRTFYETMFEKVVEVSSMRAAEAVKVTENVFRAVNIALVNELKMIFDAMGLDVWEVIDAAATKPFGYMPFYPGPGLGGHCIPIDPFYLTWKSHEYGLTTRFIELAGEINTRMPHYVVGKLENALDKERRCSLGSARIMIVGIAYKKNVSDVRESASFEIMNLLQARGAQVDYHDPLVPAVPSTRKHPALKGKRSVDMTPDRISGYDAILIATDHDTIDYHMLSRHALLVLDTRNAFGRRGVQHPKLYKA